MRAIALAALLVGCDVGDVGDYVGLESKDKRCWKASRLEPGVHDIDAYWKCMHGDVTADVGPDAGAGG